MIKRLLWGALAYMLPTFPLGFLWHLVMFQSTYDSLEVYRADIIIPFGIGSMIIQGIAWAYVYVRLFEHETVWRGAMKFASLALPLAWSFLVLAVAAKHRMASVPGFLAIESAFTVLQYVVVSPLIALACRSKRP